MYTYQKSKTFFAQHAGGMESALTEELAELNVDKINPSFHGIFFESDLKGLYRVNYMSRIATRIFAPLLTFDCHSTQYLYQTAVKIEWRDFMSLDTTFSISSSLSNSKITHSQYAALCLKDAIVDYFRNSCGKRPNVDTIDPDIAINLHIADNRAAISLNTSGGSLHKRGYRTETVEAPMQETLAAAIIRLSGWDGSKPLYDPMCGSGTLLSEAMMKYCRIPPASNRKKFGFEFLPDFDRNDWLSVKKEADAQIRNLPNGLISGSDISSQNISASKKNFSKLPDGKNVILNRADFNSLTGLENRIIVCNPPYGIRSGNKDEMEELYISFGEFLKHKCNGSEAYIYIGERGLLKHIKLRKSWKVEMKNGGLDGILVKFEMY